MQYKWQFKEWYWYKIKKTGNRVEIFNTRTNRRIKQTVIGTSRGYWIKSKWFPLSKINDNIELIEDVYCPF